MAGSLGTMVATLVANTKPFEQKMRRASKDMKGFGSEVQKQTKDLKQMGKQAISAIAAFMGFRKIIAILKEISRELFRLNKTAMTLGMSAQELREWEFVAAKTGMEVQNLSLGMMQLQKAITRILVGEGRDVATALHAIGVSVQQLETLSPEDAFMAVVEGLHNLNDAGLQATYAMILFEDHLGMELMPLLQQGPGVIDDLREHLRGMTNEIDGDLLLASKNLHNAQTDLNAVWADAKMALFELYGPALTALTQALVEVISVFTQADKQTQIFLLTISIAVPAVIMLHLALTTLLIPALKKIYEWLKAITLFQAKSPFMLTLMLATMLFVQLGLSMEDAEVAMDDLQDSVDKFNQGMQNTNQTMSQVVAHMKEMERLRGLATKWTDLMKIPDEVFSDTIQELVDLHTTIDDLTGQPFITFETFNRGIAHAINQLMKAKDVAKDLKNMLRGVQAVTLGTMEEVSARLSATRQANVQQQYQQKQLQLQQQTNQLLQQISNNTGIPLPIVNLVP
jgi:hypothetical protein